MDDFQVVLEHTTDPAQYPVFHYWRTHTEEALRMDEEAQLAFFLPYASALEEALALVVSNHIETRTPVVLEGDFILPCVAVHARYGAQPEDGQAEHCSSIMRKTKSESPGTTLIVTDMGSDNEPAQAGGSASGCAPRQSA